MARGRGLARRKQQRERSSKKLHDRHWSNARGSDRSERTRCGGEAVSIGRRAPPAMRPRAFGPTAQAVDGCPRLLAEHSCGQSPPVTALTRRRIEGVESGQDDRVRGHRQIVPRRRCVMQKRRCENQGRAGTPGGAAILVRKRARRRHRVVRHLAICRCGIVPVGMMRMIAAAAVVSMSRGRTMMRDGGECMTRRHAIGERQRGDGGCNDEFSAPNSHGLVPCATIAAIRWRRQDRANTEWNIEMAEQQDHQG